MKPAPATQALYGVKNRIYETDINDEQWKPISQILPQAKPGGRPRSQYLRTVVDGIFYLLKTGCQSSILPSEFQSWGSVCAYFRSWMKAGICNEITDFLRAIMFIKEGKDVLPTVGIIDLQSVKSSSQTLMPRLYRRWPKTRCCCSLAPHNTRQLPRQAKSFIKSWSPESAARIQNVYLLNGVNSLHALWEGIFARNGALRHPNTSTVIHVG